MKIRQTRLLGSWMMCGLLFGACSAEMGAASGGEELAIDQNYFNFTVAADRDLFQGQDIEFRGTVGPYAYYKVTGPNPRLVGPRVFHEAQAGGRVMFCGAAGYYDPERTSGRAELALMGGMDGEQELAGVQVQALAVEDCADADDRFSERPDLDEEVIAEAVEIDLGGTEQLNIDPDGMSEGSMFLVREINTAVDRMHSDNNAIPAICCEGDFCTLQEAD